MALSLAVTPADAAPTLFYLFTVTNTNPTLQDWTRQLQYLLKNTTPDAGLAINLEAGKDAVPLAILLRNMATSDTDWWWRYEEPTTTTATVFTAYLLLVNPGYPTIRQQVKWKKMSGNWRISNETLCYYAGTFQLGAPAFCR